MPESAATASVDALWRRAVVLGAMGRYLPAWHCLGRASSLAGVPPAWRSLLRSQRGSHLRQVGAGDLARIEDTSALDLTRGLADDPHTADDLERAEQIASAAVVDARLGVAADAIAAGESEAAAQHLDAARERLATRDLLNAPDPVTGRWRLRTRAEWVSAELSLLIGDVDSAREHADRALVESGEHSVRHRVKSEAIRAAVLVASGDGRAARVAVSTAMPVARLHGWASLIWPLALIALDTGESIEPELIEAGAQATRTIEAHLPADLAGHWRVRPDVGRLRSLVGG